MGLGDNISRLIETGTQKLGSIAKISGVKASIGAAVLFALQACGGGGGKNDGGIDVPPVDAVQKLNAQIGGIVSPVVEIEITDKDGNIKVIPQSQFTQSYVKSLPEGALAYAVVVDGVKTKIQGLPTDKVQILSQFANEITDYIQRNKLNSSGVRELLKAIAFPDINKDGAIDEKDVVSKIPSEYKTPFASYLQLLKDGATETQIKEELKKDFEKQNLVSDVQKTDPNTGEIVVTLTASSSNRTLLVQIIRSEEAQTGKVQFAAPMYSGENIMQVQSGESITLLPGDKIIYGEKDNILNAESAKKEIINQKDKPQLKETQFKLKEDEKVSGKLEAQYVGVTNFKIVTPPTKGKLTLNADGTFEYAGGEDQYGLDTAVVSFELSGKVYQTQTQFNIEAVNDIPTSKNLDLGAVEFGTSKTLSANDIATDKDGDTLKIVIASTTTGASVTLNADGTLTFTADKIGAGEILVMVTDDKSEPVAMKVSYNVSDKPLEKAALESKIQEAEKIDLTKYTPSSAKVLTDAIIEAKKVLSNPENQSKIDAAIKALDDAIKSLKELANKETLKSLIAVAEGFLAEKDDYTKGSFASFESKLTAAKAIVENKDATSEDVKKAEDDLTVSVAALVSIKDLKVAIASIDGLNSATYTPASWAALQSALTEANAVKNNDNASKDEVSTATTNLTNAKNALVLKDVVGPTGTPSYSTTAPTNGDVTVTINLNEDATNTPAGWTRVNARQFTKVFSANGTESPIFRDAEGNEKATTVVVSNIDKTPITGSVGYSTTSPTNGDVTVTITTSKAVASIAGWTKTGATTFTKTYTGNGSETVNFVDAAGNAGSVNVSVTNIDKVAPNTLVFVSTGPSKQGTTYTGIEMSVGERVGSITSITASNGGVISGETILPNGNISFNLITPNATNTVITVSGTDEAGNAFSRSINNPLTIWNTAEITGSIHDAASSIESAKTFDVKSFMVSTSGVSGYSISGDVSQYVTIDNNGIIRIKGIMDGGDVNSNETYTGTVTVTQNGTEHDVNISLFIEDQG